MRRLVGGLALVTVWIAASPVGAGAAPLQPAGLLEAGAAPMQFSVKGSNGHRISFEGAGRRVSVTVENVDGLAMYSARGKARDGVLRAGFGDLGRIMVRFEPSGKVTRRNPPKECDGKPVVARRGVFLGTIRFRGEGGYARVATKRARGSTTTSPRWRCKEGKGKPGDDPEAVFDEVLNGPVLATFTPGSQVVFAALAEDGPKALGSVLFLVGAREKLGQVQVERFTFAFGEKKEKAFEFDPGLTAATISPPKPFSGSASFQRNPDGTTTWSGSLAVSLPGAPNLALTGPAFTTDLAKPETAGELFALLGQPGLAGL